MTTSLTFGSSQHITGRQVAAARRFYVEVLGGREVRRDHDDAEGNASMFFVVGHILIEAGLALHDVQCPVVIGVDDVERVAARCWDAGFTVDLPVDAVGLASVTLVDPFGRCIDIVSLTL